MKSMAPLRLLALTIILITFFQCSASKGLKTEKIIITDSHYKILKHESFENISFDGMIDEIKDFDVVLIGEKHNDPVSHYVEFETVKRIHAIRNKAAVSMEMFERDAQMILDEYLRGDIEESFLIKDGRAWKNYESDYKPVVEYAKVHGLDVIAANAPRRYIRVTSKKGFDKLAGMPGEIRPFLAPLPVRMPDDKLYQEKFMKLMTESMPPPKKDDSKKAKEDEKPPPTMPHSSTEMNDGILRSFYSQVLWDATMAYSIGEYYTKNPDVPVIHFVGSFHIDNHLGIVQHLKRDFPEMRIVTISVVPVDEFPEYDKEKIDGLADYIIIADNRLPRTY